MAIENPLDILRLLKPLSWRGIEVPCQDNSVSFTNRIAKHPQYGIDGAALESTGRDPIAFKFTIPFRTGIAGYTDLYPTRFRAFWDACLDGSVGELIHPEFGAIQCRVDSYALQASPNKRDGYDVDVAWIEDATEGAVSVLINAASIDGAIALAGSLDVLSEAMDPPAPSYDDGTGLTLAGALRKLSGMINQAGMSASNAVSQIDNILDATNEMILSVNNNTDPNASEFGRSLRSISSTVRDIRDNSARGTTNKIVVYVADLAGSAPYYAARFGMKLDEFLALNPDVAAVGRVARGAQLYIVKQLG